MERKSLFKSLYSDGLLIEVVDMTSINPDRYDSGMACHENRQLEKAAAQIAVDCMFNRHVEIKHAPDGHPYIEGVEGSLSISHARNILVAVYSPNHVIGVDIEYQREALKRVATKFLNETEQEYVTDIENLLRAWTVKEAVYKAMLHKGLSLFAIKLPPLDEKEPHAVVKTDEGQVSIKLYFGKIDEAMVTLAVRDDAEYRETDLSLQPDWI